MERYSEDDNFTERYSDDYDYSEINTTSNDVLYNEFHYVFFSIILAISFLILFGNSLVLAAVFKFSNLRTTMNVQIVNLACADLLLGVSMLIYAVTMFLLRREDPTSTRICFNSLSFVCMIFSTTTSGFFLLSISIDRFIAISLPYRYHVVMAKRRIVVICSLIWLYSLLWVSFPFFGTDIWIDKMTCKIASPIVDQVYTAMFIVQTLLTIVALPIPYFKLYFIAARKIDAILLLKLTVTRKESTDSSLNERVANGSIDSTVQYGSSTFRRNIKAAKTVALIVGIYLVCVTPFVLVILLQLLRYEGIFIEVAWMVTLVLLTLNSAINPLIYHVRNLEFRLAFKKIIRRKII